MVFLLIGGAIVILCAILHALGFAASGIIAGSIAAIWQSSIGNVVAGTAFAAIQSFAALFWGRFLGLPGLGVALIFVIALWNGYLWY